MTAVIYQLSIMVITIIIGYICTKTHITGPEFNRHTSAIVTNVLLPATILKSMTGLNHNIRGGELLYVIALFFFMMGIAGMIGYVFSKIVHAEDDERGVFLSTIMYMNIGFIGFPLVESYYGAEGMLYACLCSVPMNILMFSAGVASIVGDKSVGINLKQLLNTPLITTIIGIFIMIFRINLPSVVSGTIYALADATIPISMLILGSSLAGIPIKTAFTDIRIYIVTIIRLIICPSVTYAIISLFIDNEMLVGTVTILASTPVATLLTPLCVQYGKNDQLASKSIFISTIISMITMPLIIWGLL